MIEKFGHVQLFLFLTTLVAAWSLIILGVQKILSGAQKAELVKSFETLAAQIAEIKKVAEQNQSIERQILELKADLPLNYVRKEDFIRHEVVINTKLDRLRDLIESLRERRKEKRQEDI
jgi:hypothetical protein